MAITYWFYGKHIYFRIGQLQCVHRPWPMVYKVDYFVLGTLLSSFILLNIKVVFYFYSKT